MSKQQASFKRTVIPHATAPKQQPGSTSSSSDEERYQSHYRPFGVALPQDTDYDVLSNHISGAIVRVFGGSQIGKDSNAASSLKWDRQIF